MDWDSVVEDLGPRLYRYFCARFTHEQADDLTQETLIRLVRKVDTHAFDPSKGNLSMLGFGIAHFVALESKPPPPHEDIEDWHNLPQDDSDLVQSLIAREAAVQVRNHFQKLSPIEQQVLSLLIDKELGLGEVARIMGIPEGTVKSHSFRAKQKLILLTKKENLS